MRRAVLILGALVLLVGLGLGLARVSALAGGELDRFGEVVGAGQVGSTPLVRGTLEEGQQAFFEVCAEDRFEHGWDDVAFEVWHLGDGALAQRIDASRWRPRVQASEGHACAVVLRWESVLVPGEYGLRMDGAPTGPSDPSVRGRVAAWRGLGDADLLAVLLSLVGGLVLLGGLALRPRAARGFDAMAADALGPPAEVGRRARLPAVTKAPALLRVGVAVALLLGALVGLSAMQGSLLGLLRALVLASVQIALAVALIAPEGVAGEGAPARRGDALGLVRPRPGWWVLLLAPPAGVAIWFVGAWLAGLVPSTSLSAVEAFVSYPSGALALAVVAVVVPIAEELFFRGFVYGVLAQRHGRWIAIAVTVVAFAVAHLPQQWGAWGPFVSVTFTGLALTLLRAGTRSTLVPALAHLTHNAAITILSLA